jgi:ferredoxin-NADP reductase
VLHQRLEETCTVRTGGSFDDRAQRDQLVFADEIFGLAQEKGARYVTVEGARVPGRDSWLPAAAAHLADAAALTQLVPDVAERDIFLCGAPKWMEAARRAALNCGVPSDHVHLERFEY